MSLLVLSAQDVDKVVSEFHPSDLEVSAASVFYSLSSCSDYAAPLRTSISSRQHTTLFMPSRVPHIGTAIKIVSVPSSPDAPPGLPASTLVLDEASGRIKAIVNATALTALRTAAGSVLATRLLLSKLPKTLVVFGAGQQIKSHVHLHLRTFPSFKTCTIVNRTNNTRLHELASSLRQSFPSVVFDTLTLNDSQLKDVVRGADVICTATSSEIPLFPSEWVSPGAHLNLVGSFTPRMCEVDSDLINRAQKVVVDSRVACASEAGELIAAGMAVNPRESLIELGELMEKDVDGKVVPVALPKDLSTPDGVTIFKSVGVGLQDVAIASLVLSYAESMEYGTRIENYHV